MTKLVADISGLVSLGITDGTNPDPLSLCLAVYDVFVPTAVIEELQEIASYNDIHGRTAIAVCDRTAELTIQSVNLDAEFPLDDDENAAVTLANEIDAELFLRDEFNNVGLIHASLANTRLVTTPMLLSVFVRTERLTAGQALALLEKMSNARSWNENSYVQRARSLLDSS
jgi:predicted nucleic acid-binding protein